MGAQTIKGYYGSSKIKTDIFIMPYRGGFYYAVEGSQIVNYTTNYLSAGIWVEEVEDIDCFTLSNSYINSEEDLEEAVKNS